jgi:hypothetical protein
MLLEVPPPHILSRTALTFVPLTSSRSLQVSYTNETAQLYFSLISASRHRRDSKEQEDPPVFLKEGLLRHFVFCRGFFAVGAYDSWLA